jgi:lipopolysaccharide biosynthesis glycosyltransferase
MEIRFTSYTQSSVSHYEVVAVSVLRHNPGAGFQHVVTPGLDTSRLQKIIEDRGGRYRAVVRERVCYSDGNPVHGNYLKLNHYMLGNAFIQDSKPFIIMDDDMLCRGSLSPVLNVPIGFIGAVKDCSDRGEFYVNAGLVVAHPYSAENDIFVAILRVEQLNLEHDTGSCKEQTVINHYFKNKIKLLPKEFNFQQEFSGRYRFFPDKEPIVAHFICETKPWNGLCGNGFEKYFTEHREIAAELDTSPIHAAWAANSETDFRYSLASFLSMQFHTPRTVVPHFFVMFDCNTLIERNPSLRKYLFHRFSPDDLNGWNWREFTPAVFLKNIAPFKVDSKRLIVCDNDVLWRVDAACFYDFDLQGRRYAAFEDNRPNQINRWKLERGIRHHWGHLICCDVEKIKEAVSFEVLSKNARSLSKTTINPDEDLWGATHGNNWTNSGDTWFGFNHGLENLCVTHFIQNSKPWGKKIYSPSGKLLADLGEKEVTCSLGNASAYYPEWLAHYSAVANFNFDARYSGLAKALPCGVSLLGLPIPTFGLRFIAKSDILYNGFIGKGEEFSPQVCYQYNLLKNGAVVSV